MTRERATAPRAAVLGLCAVVLGAAAHGEAGGAVAATAPVVAVTVLVVLATALLGARPGPTGRTIGVLAAGQLALHLALPTGEDGHGHHETATAHGPGMVLAHLAVAVLGGGALVRADRTLALAAHATLARGITLLVAGPVPASPGPSAIHATPVRAGGPRRAVVGRHPRRGPPPAR